MRDQVLYKASCHCGKVAFEVEGELSAAIACNCSMCSRRGSLLWAVPRDNLVLLTSETDQGTYTFGQGSIAHRFCSACGIHTFGEHARSDGERSAYVNIRCFENLDLKSVQVIEFDGASV